MSKTFLKYKRDFSFIEKRTRSSTLQQGQNQCTACDLNPFLSSPNS